ncbi:MAG: SAM-dependent methyltransferase [Acidimicrobiia bacterium]
MPIALKPIGVVRTDAQDIPRHWSVSDLEGTLVINDEFAAGLSDIEAGQRLVVIFAFDRSPRFSVEFLRQESGEDGVERGVFSLCSPIRPNPIGMSILLVLAVEGCRIHVRGIDMFEGTPILDLKPHVEIPY